MCNTGIATVTFTATDDCENYVTTVATFRIVDTQPPVLVEEAPEIVVGPDPEPVRLRRRMLNSYPLFSLMYVTRRI